MARPPTASKLGQVVTPLLTSTTRNCNILRNHKKMKLKEIEKIRGSFKRELSLPIEEVFEVLQNKMFEQYDIVVLRIYEARKLKVSTSQSVYKLSGEKPGVARDLGKIIFRSTGVRLDENQYVHGSGFQQKNLDKVIDSLLLSKGFEIFKFRELKAYVRRQGGRNTTNTTRKALESLLEAHWICILSSLNRINYIKQQADHDVKIASRKITANEINNLGDLARYFGKRYKIGSMLVEYSLPEKNWKMKSRKRNDKTAWGKISDEFFALARRGYISKRLPTSFLLKGYYIVFLPANLNADEDGTWRLACGDEFFDVILLYSESPFPTHLIESADAILEFFSEHFSANKKHDIFNELRKDVIELVRKDWINEDRPYTDMFKIVCEKYIARFSNIYRHSGASVNLFNPSTRKVESITKYSSSEKLLSHLESPLQFFGNLNKQAFKECNRSDHSIFEMNGLTLIIFPLHFHRVKVGTVCLYAALEYFSYAAKDLRKFVSLLESYFTMMFDLSDKAWLCERSHVYMNLHELKNVAGSIRANGAIPPIDREILASDILKYSVKTPSEISDREFVSLNFIKNQKMNYFAAIQQESAAHPTVFSETRLGRLANRIIIQDLDRTARVTGYQEKTICLLLRDLFVNFVKYGGEKGKFYITCFKGENLRISIYGYARHDPGSEDPYIGVISLQQQLGGGFLNIANLGVKPVPGSTHGKKEHHNRPVNDKRPVLRYGLFIVGMLARHIGGFFYAQNFVSDDRAYKRLEFRVEIPIVRPLNEC